MKKSFSKGYKHEYGGNRKIETELLKGVKVVILTARGALLFMFIVVFIVCVELNYCNYYDNILTMIRS